MEQYYKLKCGKLYDGIQARLQPDMEILTEGRYIKAVGHRLACPEGTEVIDLSDLTVTPGMIDAHVHPNFFDVNEVYLDTLYNSDGYRCLATYHTAEKALHGGFTTIRCMGWFRESYELDVKRAIQEGHLPGARMITTGHLLGTSGGHGDMSQTVRNNPLLADFLERTYPGTGNGPDFFAAQVRREKKLGADFIKIMATGGFATPNDDPDDIQMSDAELRAVFDTAKSVHIPVTAHAYGPGLMRKLIGFGIEGLEHASLMDGETARMCEAAGTYVVPTILPIQDSLEGDEENMAKRRPTHCEKLHKYQDRLRRALEIILDSQIKLGYGTDIVALYQNYESGWEYRAWMRQGVDPFRILQAATKNNAEICGIGHLAGTLEPGKYADISGWKRDLLTDEHALRDCSFVMKEGAVYEAHSYMAPQ